MNKTRIKITHIKDYGKIHEMYCDKILMLRHARKVGDTEVVNNYVLGVLKRNKGNDFNFEKIESL